MLNEKRAGQDGFPVRRVTSLAWLEFQVRLSLVYETFHLSGPPRSHQ